MPTKIYVLDTNVLLHDSEAIFHFQDNEVVVPLSVIEELDTLKREGNETGRNARRVARSLDKLREQGVLTNGGVPQPAGGRLRVALSLPEDASALPPDLDGDKTDNRILAVAKRAMGMTKNSPVVLVTKDTNLRIKAHAVGIGAEDYETDKVRFSELYTGASMISVCPETVDEIYRAKEVPAPKTSQLFPQEGVTLTAGNQSALGRVSADGATVRLLADLPKSGVWGVSPRNREQRFALDLLCDPDSSLVPLIGKAGTGKTLLAIAAGLQGVRARSGTSTSARRTRRP